MKQAIISPDISGYYLGEARADNFKEGMPAIIIGPGIGESGQKDYLAKQFGTYPTVGLEAATKLVLSRMTSWGSDSKQTLGTGTDAMGYNLITVSPKNEYDNHEYQSAAKYAREVLKASRVALLGNSLGMFGGQRQIGLDPDFINNFACVASLVSGPGTLTPQTATNIARSKVPVLWITVENDIASGTNPNYSIQPHLDILTQGGNSYLMVYSKGQWTDKEAHQIFFPVVSAWTPEALQKFKISDKPTYTFSGKTITQANVPNLVTKPAMTIYDFLLNASKDLVIDPSKPLADQLPKPQPAPVPDPVPVPAPTPDPVVVADPIPVIPVTPAPKVELMDYYISGDDKSAGKLVVDLYWADRKDADRRRSDSTQRLQGIHVIYPASGKKQLNLNWVLADGSSKSEIIGPYRTAAATNS